MNFIKSNFIFLGVVLLIVVAIFYAMFSSSKSDLPGPVGPSNNTNGVSIVGGKIDLKGALDPSVIPGMVEGFYKAGATKKLEGQKMVEFVMQELQKGIEEISMVDLDNDGNADQIYVVPSGDQEQLTLSIRVPDPEKVPTLPTDGSEASVNSMQDIAENKSIEIVSVMVTPKMLNGKIEGFNIQSEPNRHLYESSPRYYHHYSPHSALYGYLMVRTLFGPPLFWRRGYYYGYGGYYRGGYRPMATSRISRTRTSRMSSLNSNRAGSTKGGMKTASGRTVSSKSASSKAAPKSVSKFKSSAVKARASSRSPGKSSGFGRNSSTGRGKSSSGGSRSGK
ncbi:MAG: hypothetical protein COA79_00570 [Planctomycetota bacterium]|nr:MAG: hypothetical protein COA79_00570 [Planctomycetota bacterium]